MNAQVARTSPDFAILGGDIAYTVGNNTHPFGGKNWKLKRWQTFFTEWKRSMITKEGRLIPLLIVLGNHDIKVTKDPEKPKVEDTLIYKLFAFPENLSYRTLDAGNYLSLSLLDTGHHHSVAGAQTTWLEKALEERKGIPYKMAVYHVGAYPSSDTYKGKTSAAVRTNWSPLFEKYGVQAAFENHSHCFKRTHKIKEGKIAEDGILYLGDGSWGVPVREPLQPKDAWYLAKSSPTNAFWLVTLTPKAATFQAFDNKGKSLDSLTLPPHK